MIQLIYENETIFYYICLITSLIFGFTGWCIIIPFDHRKYPIFTKLYLIVIIACIILFIMASNAIINIEKKLNNIEK